jgi:hypothetical protein
MTKRRIAPGILVVRFASQYGLASTFLRVQEHYESSRFRNRVFSLEEFMDWYADRFGAFTYYEDWSGFNVPSTAFAAFYAGRFDPLLRKERRLLGLFRREPRPFYVIGITTDVHLKHELAHALFFTRPAYRDAVLAAMRRYDTSAIRKRLAAIGYHRAVLTDEAHAHLLAPSRGFKVSARLAVLRAELRSLYRHHAAGLRVQ